MQIGTDEDKIKALYRDYWQCMIEKNADGLRDMMADDYYLLRKENGRWMFTSSKASTY